MKRTTELPLLLSPAGGEAAFLAAVAAGADAVYLGGSAYNARAYAENFDEETLARCVKLAHAHGVKVHVTMNTLLTDRELEGALAWAGRLWEIGVDALIVADVGLISCLHERYPDFALHASTQLSLHSSAGTEEVSDLGFEVVVMARELDRENLTSAVRRAPACVEGFVHGALCVSYSGQCLFSSLVGGRSGNRGECAQPCRLPYNGGYPLSLKDLSLAEHIPSLIDDGIACLKIEGRMKSPAYVWGVTKIYRRLLDEGRGATKEEKATLARIFSRDGHTDGYYTKRLASMTGVRREEDKRGTQTMETEVPQPPRVPLTAICTIKTGERAVLTLQAPDGRTGTAWGDIPATAMNAPLTADRVSERLAKMGGTPYELPTENIALTLDEGLNLSPAAINALRRDALGALDDMGRTPVNATPLKAAKPAFHTTNCTALFMQREQWDALSDVERDMFDIAFVPLDAYADMKTPPGGVYLPPVILDNEEERVMTMLTEAKERGATHALCSNPAQVKYAREAGLIVIGDFRLNITNSHAAAYWSRHGVTDAILSPELTAPQMRDIGGRTIVYGRIPMMLTERCYASSDGTCRDCHTACKGAVLADRRGAEFPILRMPDHRNLVLNSLPTYMGDRKADIPQGVGAHFLFTVERADEIHEVLAAWNAGASLGFAARRFNKRFPQTNTKEEPIKQGVSLKNDHIGISHCATPKSNSRRRKR